MKPCRMLLVGAFLLGLGSMALAAINVDGTNYVTVVNPLGQIISEEVGNYSVAQANADAGMIAWDMEPAEFTPGEQLNSILCHPTLSTPITKRIWFDAVSPYGRILDGSHTSSGSQALTYNSRNSNETVIRMTDYYGETDIVGVGFVVSRLVADMPIAVYDDADNLLYSGVISAHSGDAYSWFGYRGGVDIAKIVMDTSDEGFGSQFWIDDFAVTTTVPEPATIALLGLGLGVLRRRQ